MKKNRLTVISIFGFITNPLICLALFLFIHLSVQAQKNDTVYLLNGDRITGEIKKFEYGILSLKTDAMQTVSIEFDRINTVYSRKYYEIRSINGYRHYGSLINSDIRGSIKIITRFDTISKPVVEIVQITSIKDKFIKRVDGYVDLGMSYTKASDVFQYNLGIQVTHRTTKYFSKFQLNSIFTDQSSEGLTRKNDVSLSIDRLMPGPWFAGIQTKGQQNTELDLDYRLQAGVGGGYDFIRTNSNRFYGMGGFLVNQEKTIDSAYLSINFEGLLSLQYKWFQYRHPKIDFTTGFNCYPSFTVKERMRLEYDMKAKFEIITDLFFSLTLYDNYDSRPSEDESAKNDWGIITSIGYSF